MHPPTRYSIATDNVLIQDHRIAHATFGEGDPVILIHGTPSSSLIWRDVAPRIVEAGYRVHLFDLLGFGQSERPWNSDTDTSVTAQVSILLDLMDHWGLTDAHIVGHDIGGGIAQRLAVFHREALRSLTLIDVVSYDSWPSPRTRQQMADGLETLIKAPDADHRAHFRDWILGTATNKEKLSAESLDAYVALISGPVGQASLFQHQVRHYDSKHTAEVTEYLHTLSDLPTQIIWGADDLWQITDWAHKLHAAIPGSHLHILPDCGHFAMEDKPEDIANLVVDLIAGI